MKLSIITPTILRTTLTRCIESAAMQTFQDFEHILVVDKPEHAVPSNSEWLSPNVRWLMCGKNHNNYGNSCRRLGVQAALGNYICYLDDDDYYRTENALGMVVKEIERLGNPLWGVTQMVVDYSHGPVLFTGFPPKRGKTGTNQIWHRRVMPDGVMPMFPDVRNYEADGMFAEELAKQYGDPVALSGEPLVCVSGVGGGKWF